MENIEKVNLIFAISCISRPSIGAIAQGEPRSFHRSADSFLRISQRSAGQSSFHDVPNALANCSLKANSESPAAAALVAPFQLPVTAAAIAAANEEKVIEMRATRKSSK